MGGSSAVAEAPPPPARLAPTDLFPERSPQQPSPPLSRPPHAATRVSKARRLLVRLRSHWLFTGTFALLMATVLYLSLAAATLFVMYVVLGAAVEPQRMLPVLLSVVALLVLGRQVRPTTLTPPEPSRLSRSSPLPPQASASHFLIASPRALGRQVFTRLKALQQSYKKELLEVVHSTLRTAQLAKHVASGAEDQVAAHPPPAPRPSRENQGPLLRSTPC